MISDRFKISFNRTTLYKEVLKSKLLSKYNAHLILFLNKVKIKEELINRIDFSKAISICKSRVLLAKSKIFKDMLMNNSNANQFVVEQFLKNSNIINVLQ